MRWLLPSTACREPGRSAVGVEQPAEGRFALAHSRLGQDHRLRLARGIGDKPLLVKTLHRGPVEPLPRPRASDIG